MKAPSTSPLPPAGGSLTPDSIRLQILASEHSNLLSTRSMTWSEAFSRASMFLTILSAAIVALALVAQATAFGQDFRLFALVVLPIVLLVGLGTYGRLVAININDFYMLAGMNRLRHAYLEMAPELEPYFVNAHHDDIAGIQQTVGRGARPFNMTIILSSTPLVIAIIDAVVTGVLVALFAQTLGAPFVVSALAGAIGGVILLIALFTPAARWFRRQRRDYRPRFPG